MNKQFIIAGLAISALTIGACGSDDSGATATFAAPSEGDTFAGGVVVDMAAEGVTIEEAGEVNDGAGHFHVIADAGCLDAGETITKDGDHVHFGKGQTTGTVYLEPGTHDLCLQVGDGVHEALDVTDTVTIEVGIESQDEWCAVVGELDDLFAATDETADFPTQQAGSENARRLIAQLTAATDHVDESARAAVAQTLAFVEQLTEAIVQSSDEAAADAALTPVFESMSEVDGQPATAWILDTCDVDIDD